MLRRRPFQQYSSGALYVTKCDILAVLPLVSLSYKGTMTDHTQNLVLGIKDKT